MKLVQSFTMLTVTTGDEGAVANRRTRAIDDGSDEVMGARKKARCEEPTSPRLNPSSSISSRVNLRVDVNASLLASPRRVPNVRRSPIANRHVGDVLISDDEERSDNGDLQREEPFVLARRLLRRRHVRKEQLRKERGARGRMTNMGNVRNRRNSIMVRDSRGNRRQHSSMGRRGSLVGSSASVAPTHLRPQLSPMLIKGDSFSDMANPSPVQTNVSGKWNASWNSKSWFSQPGNGSSPVDAAQGSVTMQVTPSPTIVPIVFPHNNGQPNRLSFSPLRSRNRM